MDRSQVACECGQKYFLRHNSGDSFYVTDNGKKCKRTTVINRKGKMKGTGRQKFFCRCGKNFSIRVFVKPKEPMKMRTPVKK